MATETTYDAKIQNAVSEVLDTPSSESRHTLRLSSGVVLRLKPIPVLRVQAILNRFKYPPIPELYDDKKDRYYRNPNSPEYLEMREQVDVERILAVIDAIIASGTVVEEKPDDVPALEDDSWIEELEVTQVVEVKRESPTARYLAWVKYVAIVTQEDMVKITQTAGLTLGTSEAKVAQSLQESFPNK